MPIRAIIIMLVAAVILAVCYRDPIYKWYKNSIVKNKPDEESEEKEKKD